VGQCWLESGGNMISDSQKCGIDYLIMLFPATLAVGAFCYFFDLGVGQTGFTYILAAVFWGSGVSLLYKRVFTQEKNNIYFFVAFFLLTASVALYFLDIEYLALFYPVLANLFLFILFFRSLQKPPSLVERLARLTEPELPAEGVRYTRRVTEVWSIFFLLNMSVALWSVFFFSLKGWAFYNCFLSYILVALLFSGEWAYRRLIVYPRLVEEGRKVD